MSFWSTAGKIAKGAVDSVSEANQKAKEIADDYRREDDEFLKEKLHHGGLAQRMAAAMVLKERGYGSQD